MKRAARSETNFTTVSDKNRKGSQHSASRSVASLPVTKTHLPASHRGTWLSGTRGEGVFQYNHSLENRKAKLAGKKVRFKNQHIAVGGFPPESYYGGNAQKAAVDIKTVTATNADSLAADEAMRKKLKDPAWQRPEGFRWNHAGGPGSKRMELVDVGAHSRVAHKGPGAGLRALKRAGNGRGTTGRSLGAFTVYLVVRDSMRAAGVLKPSYEVAEHEAYHFRTEDGSVFVIHSRTYLSRAKREYVDGPRKGQSEAISDEEVEEYRKGAEAEFGKYVPGSAFTEPRFIPGKRRSSLPLIIEKNGVPHEAGWIDEKGVHRYSEPRPLPI